MITFAESVTDKHGRAQAGDEGQQDQDVTYTAILRTLQTCPLGQEDDARHLTETVVLGEN